MQLQRLISKIFILTLAGLFLQACNTPAEEKAPLPNILFAIADDVSYPHMGAYGTTWVHTPAFDRVAREGLLFTRAYTPNAKCAPSRSCILTGRNSWQLEEAANHWPVFPTKFKTYAEALMENGYHVGSTGKGWAPGKALDAAGNARKMTGKPYRDIKLDPPAAHISNEDYAANFKAFMEDREEGQPFCFWYGALEPHRAYEFGAGVSKGGKDLSDIDEVPSFWPQTDSVRHDMLDYAFEIEHFDTHLGLILQMLEEAGELDNTLVVVTADNGMPFPRAKGQGYEWSNHLPLSIMWKNGIKDPGRTVDDYVSFIDFAPTFLEIASQSAESTGMQGITGRSLMDLFKGERSLVRDHVLIGKERHDVGRPGDQGYPIRGIIKDNYLYLHNFEPDRWPGGNPETGYLNCDGSPTKTEILNARRSGTDDRFWKQSFGKRPQEELYRLDLDSECVQNLVGNPEYQSLQESLKEQLFLALKNQNDPRMFGKGDLFDNYLYSDEKSRGFYERYRDGEGLNAGWVNPTDFEIVENER